MLRATLQKVKRNRHGVNYVVGICQDAKTLGVERTHLWRVLTGRRHSKSLMARYHALKRSRS